jgi:ATP-dependent helicase/nuclease subunit A
VTGELKQVAKMAAREDAAADDPTRTVVADTPSRRADAGAAWGTLIHGLLEHTLRHQDATGEDLRRLAMWLTVDEPGLRPLLDEAVATVQAVSRKEFWAAAKASPECHEEVPFAVIATNEATNTRAEVPKVLNGTIDSVFREAAGWKIVDYKTDVDATEAVLQQRYGEQLAAYVNAWRRFTSGEVTSALVDARRSQ